MCRSRESKDGSGAAGAGTKFVNIHALRLTDELFGKMLLRYAEASWNQ